MLYLETCPRLNLFELIRAGFLSLKTQEQSFWNHPPKIQTLNSRKGSS